MDPVLVYGGGSIYRGPWEKAPSHRDVQIVIFWDPKDNTWNIRHGGKGGSRCDFFRLAPDGTVVGMDQAGMIDHVVHDLGLIKQGKMLETGEWQKILKLAMELRNELRKAE